ncbi:hypothetical protein ILYODFUR_036740 [Ilyodon furcidens]|uniref:Uncharacterized protein n=1 Tax=Ilyodon furcidens TaxID=33524 RepID=A0ABV0V945_9TELE
MCSLFHYPLLHFIHSFIRLFHSGSRGLVPISSSLQAKDRVHPGQVASPSQGNTETYRTNNHAHTHSHQRAILEGPVNLTVMFLECGRKPEYPVRTCKLHAERPPTGSRTQDLLAAWQLHYRAAQLIQFSEFCRTSRLLLSVNYKSCDYFS